MQASLRECTSGDAILETKFSQLSCVLALIYGRILEESQQESTRRVITYETDIALEFFFLEGFFIAFLVTKSSL